VTPANDAVIRAPGVLLLMAALAALTIPIARGSRRGAAWYWALVGGPAFLYLIYPSLHAVESPQSPALPFMALVLFVPLLVNYLRREPLPTPVLAGERWATPAELERHRLRHWPQPSHQLSAGMLYLHTRRRNERAVYGVDAGPEGRHAVLVVPTGLGKGLWSTTQLLTWSGSAIVNDLKGDLYPQTAGWRKNLGPAYVLNASTPIHRFDPAAHARSEDDLRPLAFAICQDPADPDNYWDKHAARFLLALMLGATQAREPVFPFVARATRGSAARALDMLRAIDPTLPDRAKPVGDSRPFAGAWESLVTRCEALFSPHVLATLSGSDVTAEDLLKKPATLYLQIPEARLADLQPFLRLLWTSLIEQLITTSDRLHADHQPLLLVLDEAGRTPFAKLPDFLVTLRSRRISCAVLVQAISQLRAAYGLQADTILGNCALHLYARSEDLATAEYISKRLGLAEEVVATVSASSGPHGESVTRGQLRRFRPLRTPQQVRRIPDHAVVSFLPACPPVTLRRMDWRDHPDLAVRTKIPAPPLMPLLTDPAPAPGPTSLSPRPPADYIDPDGTG
jgi:type IV secretion system protein VirD4